MAVNSSLRLPRFMTLTLVLVLAVLSLLVFTRGGWAIYDWHVHRSLLRSVHTGMTSAEVIKRIGSPNKKENSQDEFISRLKAGGYRPIPYAKMEKEVWIYDRLYWRLCVYFDHDGRVSHVFLVRT